MTLTDPLSTSQRPRRPSAAAFLAPSESLVGKITVGPDDEAPRWLGHIVDRLNSIASSPDVDGVDPAAIGRVLKVLWGLLRVDTPTPSVVPCENGGIQCVWHKAGWDLELDIFADETTVWAREREGNLSWSGSLGDYREDTELVLKTLAAS